MLDKNVADGPTMVGVLSRLPLELRQQIYDHMCSIDSSVYEFEVEGPNNIHISPATLRLLEKTPKVPRIAHVCTEMRHYVLGAALTPIVFTCYVFAVTLDYLPESRYEVAIERRVITSAFRFRSDTLTFQPRPPYGIEEFDFGEGGWEDFALSTRQTYSRIRMFLFPGSGGLPSSSSHGPTPFEQFVQASRDAYVAAHPESARAHSVTRRDVGIEDLVVEDIVQHELAPVGFGHRQFARSYLIEYL